MDQESLFSCDLAGQRVVSRKKALFPSANYLSHFRSHSAEWRISVGPAMLGEAKSLHALLFFSVQRNSFPSAIALIYQFEYKLMSFDEKPVIWVGSSKKDLCALPENVRHFFGHAIYVAQRGLRHASAKPMQGFSSAGVLEVVDHSEGGTFRAVYTVLFYEAVFVLHCFQKKSKQGAATPREDMDVIRSRLKAVETRIKEQRNAKNDCR